MRKFNIPTLALALLLVMSACVGANSPGGDTPAPTLPPGETASPAQTAAPAQGDPAAQTTAEPTAEPAGVIAQSSNAVSDKEKEKILDDLSKELDSLLINVDNLEDIQDADLTVDDVE